MKISIIVATYNRANLIEASIKSVLNQTYQNWELIIVDDGSTDSTDTVIEPYLNDKRILYKRESHNQGSTSARNIGLGIATGDLIIVWDSDDVFYEHCLARVVELYRLHPEAGIISAHCRQILNDKTTCAYTPLVSGPVSLSAIIARALPANTKIRAVRREVFSNVRYEARNIDFTVNCYLAEKALWYHSNEELGDIYLESDAVSLTSARKKFNPKRSVERTIPLEKFIVHFYDILKLSAPQRLGALSYGLSVGLSLKRSVFKSLKYAGLAVYFDFSLKHLVWFCLVLVPGIDRILNWYAQR